MSHSSGIAPSDELADLLPRIRDSDTARLVKVIIQNEVLEVAGSLDVEGSFEDDWDKGVLSLIEPEQCCYFLVKTDVKNNMGYEWIFVSYSPDYSHVRDKMLFASTRATLKSAFNVGYIKHEMFGTIPDDVSYKGYEKHVASENAPAPLTMEEIEKKEIRAFESGAEIGSSTKKAMVATGINFPIDAAGMEALNMLLNKQITFVQLALDIEAEVTELTVAGKQTIAEAADFVPEDIARYNIIRYDHNHEGDELDSIMFVYSCPSQEMAVKERMLYASCKGPIVELLENEIGLVFAKKLEIDDGTEFTVDNFYSTLHPVQQAFTQKFSRPKGPGGRKGTSRMTGRPRRTKEDAE